MSPATAERPPLKIAFGPAPAVVFDVGVPVLAGDDVDAFFADAQPAGRKRTCTLFRRDGWLLGAASAPAANALAQSARRLYLDILQATRGLHLARIWSYVPAINQPGAGGLENYRAFCQGRSQAFEQQHGAAFKALVPAASAVGCQSRLLTVAFAASAAVPRHVENPLQVPAYDYPPEYGPRAPSFARATIVPGDAGATVFISGTAAIRGHTTIAGADLAGQLDCTLENLVGISRACGLGVQLDRGGRSRRQFKVYVRHAADQPVVARILEAQLFGPADRVCYLQADICRQPLRVEVEATLTGVQTS